jgi:hypothetical protein
MRQRQIENYIDDSIVDGVRTINKHMSSCNAACFMYRLFWEHLGLRDLLSSLRRFYFMEAGDWAMLLLCGLQTAAAHMRPLSLREIRSLVEDAIHVCPT